MALSINSNQSAINVRRNLNATTRELSTSLERLSSGLRINRAADDAAGLSVREGLRAESSGLQASVRNAEQATKNSFRFSPPFMTTQPPDALK